MNYPLLRCSQRPPGTSNFPGVSGFQQLARRATPRSTNVRALRASPASLSPLDGGDGFQEGKVKVLMAAGGTGGHVYPAIAIADEIRRLCETAQVEFVGTKDRMEWSVVPSAGYAITAIPAVAIHRPFASAENLLMPVKLLMALISCWRLLKRLRPNVVVGTGGYVSGPLCLVAAVMRLPVVVQEQNAYAGITNRLLGKFAKAVFVAFSAAVAYFPRDKCLLYGNPTRMELRQYVSAAVARRFFFPKDEPRQILENLNGRNAHSEVSNKRIRKRVVLILGGSLGARVINMAVAGMATTMLEENPTRYVIWQTGPKYYEEMVAQVKSHPRLAVFPEVAKLTPKSYVNAMHMAYAAADLVVARAGAITCSELLVTGKPSILIPSINVAEDHQTKNAEAMAEGGCARTLPESSLSSSALASMIEELLGDDAALVDMTEKALKAASPDASYRIAQHVLGLVKHIQSSVLA